MITHHKINSASKDELKQIAIQTAELNQKMYDALDNLVEILKGIHKDPEVMNAYKCHYELSDILNAELVLGEAEGEI